VWGVGCGVWADFNEGDYAMFWRKYLTYPRGWDFWVVMDFGDFLRGEMGAKLDFLSFLMEVCGGRASEGFYGVLGLNSQR